MANAPNNPPHVTASEPEGSPISDIGFKPFEIELECGDAMKIQTSTDVARATVDTWSLDDFIEFAVRTLVDEIQGSDLQLRTRLEDLAFRHDIELEVCK